MKKYFWIIAIIAALVLLALIFKRDGQENALEATPPPASVSPTPPPAATAAKISDPISASLSRITKKHFGTKVSPSNSPVSPEKFSGYHTGVDFETTSDEVNADVPVAAICDGKILQRRSATGYGGIVVQSCTIDGQAVTVVYGHLRLSSIVPAVDADVKAGDKLAVLGTGYSDETSGERKHLHLGIHKGASVNVAGYVSSEAQLSGWLDAESLLK